MRIGVMSDSHGDTAAVKRAVEFAGNVDIWLHAGDYCSDAACIGADQVEKVLVEGIDFVRAVHVHFHSKDGSQS